MEQYNRTTLTTFKSYGIFPVVSNVSKTCYALSEQFLINDAWSSSKPVALLAVILFNILEMCSTVTLTRPTILYETFHL